MREAELILASASPRRAELLAQVGVRFTVQPADIDESPAESESAEDYVRRMAREKAEAVVHNGETALPVLAADTSVVVNGEILGKPGDRDEARRMLGRLSDRCHEVLTAVCLMWQGRQYESLSRSEVCFGPLDDGQISQYLATGEADDKAGAYGIQGHAAAFVRSMSGSYSGIVGLPLYETVNLLREARLENE
jgi:septum formation protein